MIKVVSTTRMREADVETISGGTSSIVLMGLAANGIYNAYKAKGRIAVICGLGNNGGDGFALADILLDNKLNTDIYTFNGNRSESSEYYLKKLTDKGVVINYFDENTSFTGYDLIYDCIFGIGGNREVAGLYYKAISGINNSGAFIISIDIPSGLNGDSGLIMGIAVKADLTVAIGAIKSGYLLNDGMDYTGEVTVIDIGIDVRDNFYNLVEDEDVSAIFPERKRNINKGSAGKLLIIGGSSSYMGAVMLAESGAAAMRVGVGLNSIAIPKSYLNEMMLRITSSTLFPLPDNEGVIIYDREAIDKALINVDTVAIGMGMGENKDIIKIIEYLISKEIPLLIDADGLNSLVGNLNILLGHKSEIVLTPHPKEFSRLTGLAVSKILNNPIETAREFAEKYNVTVLLKGVTTIITDGEDVMLSSRGSSNMAKGGSGDVLSGIIGGFIARGIDVFRSAYGGAYINGVSGELAGKEIGEYSASPIDTVGKIAEAIYRDIGQFGKKIGY